MRAVKTFTVFAGGFLMRPLGSLVLGAVGDKYGTGAALKWSIALMTVPTVITGCLPTYQKVGIAAPLLLTVCRLLQGLSVGGELIGALLHTADHSPHEHRGFFCGLVAVFGSLGNLIGSLVSVVMRHALTDEQLLSWGWRIPFLTGSVLGFVGIFLRTQTGALKEGGGEGGEERGVLVELAETPAAVEEELATEYHHAAMGAGEEEGGREGERATSAANSRQHQHPAHTKSFCGILREAAAGDKPRFLRVVCFAALNNALFYFHFVWLGTYLAELAPNPLRAAQAFSVTCVTQAIFIVGNPIWGSVGDSVGGPSKRLRWNVTGVALSCFVPPCLFLLLGPGKLHLCYLYAVLTGLLMGFCVSGNYYAWVCESLQESPSRFLTTSVAYNLGAIVGGCTPMVASALAESKLLVAPFLPLSAVAVGVFVVLGSYEFGWGLVPGGGKGGRETGPGEGEFLSLPMTAAEELEEALKRRKKSMEKLKKRDGRGGGGEEEEAVEMVRSESL
jgi:MHS family proline/betaine transporter-like MFS transporter